MDTQEINTVNPRRRRRTNVGGLILIGVGIFLLLDKLDLDIPRWIISWPSMLIFIGIIVGIKHNFRNTGWLIMIAVGSVFLFKEIEPNYFDLKQELLWPILLIAFGIIIYIKNAVETKDPGSNKKGCNNNSNWDHYWKNRPEEFVKPTPVEGATEDDYIYTSVIFGAQKKRMLSKNFQGGRISTIFGGIDISLMQADFTGVAELEVSAIFGGVEIIVPGNWTVRMEETTIFGSAEDTRPSSMVVPDPSKVLVIRGNCAFGGIEVKSY